MKFNHQIAQGYEKTLALSGTTVEPVRKTKYSVVVSPAEPLSAEGEEKKPCCSG
jgi:hypothetical protein